jgi:hypothetical protein
LRRFGCDSESDFDFDFNFSKETVFVASHFREMSHSELSSLSLPILSEILSSKELKVASGDQLHSIVWEFISRDRSHFSLLVFVRFEFLSVSSIRRFVKSASDFLDLFDSSIWSSVSRRLVLSVSPGASNDRVAVRLFTPRSDQPLNRIISHLTSISGGNVHDLGVVVADASSIQSSYMAKHAFDLQNKNSAFHSQNQPNSWIRDDFKSARVIPTHYAISSYIGGQGKNNPKSWCFEVSADGDSWTEVHRCTNNNDLNGAGLIGTFAVTKSVKSRFIRFRQTGKNHSNNDYLLLSGLEIFGTLCDP